MSNKFLNFALGVNVVYGLTLTAVNCNTVVSKGLANILVLPVCAVVIVTAVYGKSFAVSTEYKGVLVGVGMVKGTKGT